MKTIFMAALCSLFFAACANPKYAPKPPESVSGSHEAKSVDCMAQFASGTCLTYSWEKRPTDDDFGSFTFNTFRQKSAEGTPVPEDLSPEPTVILWMPAMGHGSSPVTVEHIGSGTYRASQVFFTMKGSWELRFELKDGNAIRDQATISLTL